MPLPFASRVALRHVSVLPLCPPAFRDLVDLVVNRSTMLECRSSEARDRRPHRPLQRRRTGSPTPGSIPFELSDADLDLQARARDFVEDVLIPLEEEAERRDGKLPDDVVAEVKRAALARRLNGGLHAAEHGGQGWTRIEWSLVEEQYGRTTNAIHWHVPNGLQRLGARLRRAHRPLPAPAAARRGPGRLRRDRARRRLRPVPDRGDRRAHRQRRLAAQRREVVRHLRRPRRPSSS